jgi:hypothetical protein
MTHFDFESFDFCIYMRLADYFCAEIRKSESRLHGVYTCFYKETFPIQSCYLEKRARSYFETCAALK